jgi:hypothetical protein
MGRKSNVFLTTVGCIGLASVMSVGTAFAGSLTAGNAKLAAELIPASTAFPFAGTVDTNWTPSIGLANTQIVNVAIINGSYQNNGALNLCVGGFAVDDGTNPGTTAGDLTTQFVISGTVDSSASVVVSNVGCGAPALTAGIQVAGGTAAGSTVDMEITVPDDSRADASAPIFQVVNQFTAQVLPVNSTLSFLDFQETFVAEGATPPPFTTTATSFAGIIINSDESIKTGNKVAVTTGGTQCFENMVSVGDGIQFVITGDLQGLNDLSYDGTPVNFSAADITAGEATLMIPGNLVNVCLVGGGSPPLPAAIGDRATNFTLTNDGPGDTVPIVSGDRTIELTLDPTGGGDIGTGNTRALIAAGTTSHTFGLDATTFFIPLIKFDPVNGTDSFTKISSSSTIAGANGVTGNILTDDGTYANCTFGTITPGTAFLIQGSDWESCVATAGKTSANLVGGTSAKVIVNAPEANVQGFTNFANQGSLQRLPMQILDASRGE